MRIYDIIYKKRFGSPLTKEEIDFFVNGYVNGLVADYQASALLMAICIQGMNDEETYNLTRAMLLSGDTVDLSSLGSYTVDKHSTGGVGDKTTLIIAPIVASLGCRVAKMSGRGLGHTGGTVDKLESISGYKSTLSPSDFLKQAEQIGVVVTGQSGNLAPADKKLYALRDVTATVDCIPLIASSIMSKKLASGSQNIVLDVKCGDGAFMRDKESALLLSQAMIKIGESFGKRVSALVTNMEMPLGSYIGNALEVYEALEILSGRGEKRLMELSVALATKMASLALNIDKEEAKCRVLESIASGSALCKMKEWVLSQGGNTEMLDKPELLLQAKYKMEIKATKSGYVSRLFARAFGEASMALGAGRMKKEDEIDPFAGIYINVGINDYVNVGDTLFTLYSSSENLFKSASQILESAYELSSSPSKNEDLIYYEI